jgi:hypothetical protein
LTTVPWNTLTPGSVVNVFHRTTPYRTKIALRVSGTSGAPIVINGVTDASGNRPVMSGDGAVTATANRNSGIYSDANPEYGEGLALILIKRSQSTDSYGYKPKHLQIRNLELRSTYEKSFTSQSGQVKAYTSPSAGIWADVVEDLLLENLVITDHGFGVFVNNRNANDLQDAETSKRLTVRNSRISGNGKVNSYLEHNLYLQGMGCTLEGSYVGTLRPGAQGSSYKDRCAGTIVRNNVIDCAARCIDLVHDESGSSSRRDSPTSTAPNYDAALVSGNTINSSIAVQCVHFGGDNLGAGVGPFPTYRNGPLTFTNNRCTLNVSSYRAYVFDIQHVAGSIEASGNTIVMTGGSQIRSWLNLYGTVTLGSNVAPSLLDTRDGAIAGQYQVNR